MHHITLTDAERDVVLAALIERHRLYRDRGLGLAAESYGLFERLATSA